MAKPSTATTLSEANQAAALGKLFFESGLFKDITASAQAAVKVLAGRELGIGPIQAMTGLHVIQGKVVLSYLGWPSSVDANSGPRKTRRPSQPRKQLQTKSLLPLLFRGTWPH